MEDNKFTLKGLGLSIRRMLAPAIILILMNQFAYWFSRVIIAGRPTYDFSFDFEKQIPLLPWTVSIYLGCYAFWIFNFACCCYQKEEKAYRFFSAELLSKFICFLFFIMIPTATVRPEITEIKNIWDAGIAFVYRIDPANNLFPSLHCLESAFCVIGIWDNPRISKWYKWFSFVFAILIYLSTLTTKQHFVIDIVGGVGLAYLTYWFVKKSKLCEFYGKIMRKLTPKAWLTE